MANQNQYQPIIILPQGTTRQIGSQAKRNNIMAGKELSYALKTTLGPRGMDKMMVNTLGDVKITNDGNTILKEMDVDHPVAEMLVELAKTQEKQIVDGTTTSVVLAGELLKQAENLLEEGLSTSLLVSGFQDAASKAKETLDEISIDVNKEVLVKIAATSMKGKGPFDNVDVMAEKLVSALLNVEENGKIDMDMIKLRKIHGEAVEDTEITEGVTIDKNVLESEMPKDVKNAKIALLQYAIDARELQNDAKIKITAPGEMQAYLDKEKAMLEEEVQTIVDAGANVLFCNKKISDLGQHFLTKAGILSAKRVKSGDMERLAKATGGNIVNNIRELTSKDIGEAGHVYEREVFEDMEYIFVEDCKYPGTLNIIIRGTTKQVTDELEQAVNDAIGAVKVAIETEKAVPGAGASYMAMAKVLRKYAQSINSKKQLAIIGYAKALEEIPMALTTNAGLNTLDILTELRSAQDKSPNYGINVLKGEVTDVVKDGILEPKAGTVEIIDGATEASEQILRIDDVMAAKKEQAVGGDVPGTPNPYMM